MKKDLTDGLTLAMAVAALTLHTSLSHKLQQRQPNELVYVPMEFPVGVADDISALVSTDEKLGMMALSTIFVAGLDAIIDTFDLRNKESYDKFHDALTKQLNKAERELNIDLH